MGRAELPIWQEFTDKYRASHRRTPLVRCKTCDDEICASTTSLYQHKNNVCGKKLPRSSSSSMDPNLVGHHSPSSPGDKETIVVSTLVSTPVTTPAEVADLVPAAALTTATQREEHEMQVPRTAGAVPDVAPTVRKRKEIWEDFGDKYKVDGRKTLVVDCKMCGKDVAAATTSLYQHQAICANIQVPKQQKRPKASSHDVKPTPHPPPPSYLPVEELTKKFLTIQDTILQLRAQLDAAHADDAPALQSALDLYQAMRANVLDKLNAVAQNHCIV
ncbi:hypothetical protein DYB25_002189 [Aphanomyces astaci]|uniref:BED-type domain-containing protein n=1 Tax=Aphanomyces astaci TaxID=112090 RepID=A0A397E6W8_APHAT|nr:hypothetical protein DYB36_006004 [Aphanomyces astaci]RHY14625.1 hypothetical protein DYB25_002189 [Aphanomyces astaci]RHY62328.1 hypothetical protein DYB34_003583 [Aphanomyces astaci]RHY64139.1 hypothetical protein DYB38_003522 [Aphanomyces astaci]RHY73453.1 hypothetical protein DYB30_003729 [Aphanomyces astaci]